jgi:L-ascorbate metabolism protein UlaG (beta-lactamase superfamily)
MRITAVRNATLLLEIGGLRLLVEPALDDASARPAIEGTANPRRNPLVPLPMPAEELVRGLDAALVTHMHRDHLDATGERLLPRDIPVFCQPRDEERLRALGLDARPVDRELAWNGLTIARTGGRHGTGDLEAALGPVSGFVLRAAGEPTIYLAGDTIWCDEVESAIADHRPDVAVVNGSGARFLEGGPIVMTADDVAEAAARVPRVVVVHLEALNHCAETRAEVRARVPAALVPEDGETLELA